MVAIGEQLREAREARELTLQDIERATRIRAKYLRALEEENFEVLPGTVYVRGFLKTYARELGLDPEPLLAQVGAAPEAIPEPVLSGTFLAEPLQPTPLPITSIVSTLAVLILIGALSVGVWWAYPRRDQLMALFAFGSAPAGATPAPPETPPGVAPLITATPTFIFQPTIPPDSTATATPVPTATIPPRPTSTATPGGPTLTPAPPRPVEGVRVQVELTETAWILVRVDGEQAYIGTLPPGETREWQGKESVFLRTGNAGGVRLILNGQDQGLLGRQGEVINRTWERNPEGGLPVQVEPTMTPVPTTTGD
ncbi:MAG TPA: hypothetical protein DEP84_23885 [Chloroflexi bacterium]|nr:hypothetical protein [Chloroflexota bacterium]